MSATELLSFLEKLDELASPDTLLVWQGMGMDTTNFNGAELSSIRKVAKKAGKKTAIAKLLWDTGRHEAKLLAVHLAEPIDLDKKTLQTWVDSIGFWDLGDQFCEMIMPKSAHSKAFVFDWIASENEFVQRCAYMGAGFMAKRNNRQLEDAFFEFILEHIEDGITTSSNWVKESMIFTLTHVGSRNRILNDFALHICNEVPSVAINYGKSTIEVPTPFSVLTSAGIQKNLR